MDYNTNSAPAYKLQTNKGLLKYLLLGFITCGIYPLIVMSSVSSDINTVASKHDGRNTMHFCLLYFIIGPLTFGIANLVWSHNISERIGVELRRRGINYSFGAVDFWLWNVLGTVIFIGPFIYLYKLFKAVNLMNEHYNMYG